MLVLFETPAGPALFSVLDKGKLKNVTDLIKEFESADGAKNIVQLAAFEKFEDTTKALSAATALMEGKLDKSLKKFLKANLGEETKLAVEDVKLGKAITEKFSIKCVHDDAVLEVFRGIRQHWQSLIPGLNPSDKMAMRLGLSHSLCRYKLKFSPDKVDVMIIQAIALLDELDKELNTYAMRVREWYGWHFPEMGKIVTDNIHFAKVVKKMGIRTHAATSDLSDILPEEQEAELKVAAEVSMGTEISEDDISNIAELCEQVIEISEYRASLFDYLKNRMHAIAPNLSVMVGELVGARLIAHAGSLLSLAKQPASTVQILGAEKALFRALKTKHETPKYGLIYHASLVGQAAPKFKGRISRVLAAKAALSIRMDALGEAEGATIGLEAREKVEKRLAELEGGKVEKLSGTGKGKAAEQKYQKPAATKSYNPAADVAMTPADGSDEKEKRKKEKKDKKAKEAEEEAPAEETKAEKKKRKKSSEETNGDAEEAPAEEEGASEKKKKKKDKKSSE